ncbi:Transposon Tf2-8 polyprotein, partial [Dictyocoela roeselum]
MNYNNMEKELFAILKSLEYFKPIIFATKVVVFTDNRNILKDSSSHQRIQRWKLLLAEYNLELKHIPGTKNSQADLISIALFCKDREVTSKESYLPPGLKNNKFETHPTLKCKVENIQGLLMLHRTLGHPGKTAFYLFIRNQGKTLKGIKEKINKLTNECIECQINKNFTQKYGVTEGFLVAEKFNEKISTDILGPLKTKYHNFSSKNDYFYMVTFTDFYSKLTELEIIFSTTADVVCKSLKKKWIDAYGPPKFIVSDQGRQYVSS